MSRVRYFVIFLRLWLLSIGIGLDRLINAVLMGSCDETLSSRAYRAWEAKKWPGTWMKGLIDGIFSLLGQDKHCESAWRYESTRLRVDVTLDTAGMQLADSLRKL